MRLLDLYNQDEQLYCSIQLDRANEWIYATWMGYVPTDDAERGAEAYLSSLKHFTCPYLLNDNSRISGPWFDSTTWLEHVWAPVASELGLRYIAHVTPPDMLDTTADVADRRPFGNQFELQIFDDMAAAQEWLHSKQQLIRQAG
ncbi:hypothetical protein [Hymenobacter sp. CRA2]|uniref:hypothetical protein n=1 Tax=Hymenobacter sp. CRA2 TaxID=1955620 RepID=UPI00098FB477|nr:hypothetical protein [Hymenobacter sp. CRA2]OON70149.1 hypothetical protein B0919_05275 [Hymenobacter sp. CRA2]